MLSLPFSRPPILLKGMARPIAIKKGTTDEIDWDLMANPYPTWKKLEEMVDKGKVRNIGVSKYVSPFPS